MLPFLNKMILLNGINPDREGGIRNIPAALLDLPVS